MEWIFNSFNIDINKPLLFFSILPILCLIVWQLFKKYQARTIPYNGLEYMLSSGIGIAYSRQKWRGFLILLITIFLGFAWAAPEIRTSKPLSFGPVRQLYPTFLLAMDVSGSMTEPLGGYVINGELNMGGATRFEAAQNEIKAFVSRHPETKFGLILFSVRPMLVRLPTINSKFGFREIFDEGMKYTNPSRKRPSQLARFAGGTATRDGLIVARDVFMNQNSSSKSLILIADLIDNTEEIIEGIQRIDPKDVFVYVLAIDPDPQNLEMLTAAFNGNPDIKIFPVKSAPELATAFSEIESAEQGRRESIANKSYVQDLRWFIALISFIVAVLTILLFETKLHKTYR